MNCPRGLGSGGQGFCRSPFSPVSFTVCLPASTPQDLSKLPPDPSLLLLLSIPFFFPFFIFLPLALFPFHPLPLPAPPPQLLWQQLNARNKGRIQLGHQFPKQHPRVERGRAGGSRPAQQGRPQAYSEGGVYVCKGRGHPRLPKKLPCSWPVVHLNVPHLCQACAFSKAGEAPTPSSSLIFSCSARPHFFLTFFIDL